jgi:CheY-like chemotaxis protein
MEAILADTVLLVEDEEVDAEAVLKAFQQVKLPNPIQVVRYGDEAIQYLAGEGKYADRARYPVPGLVLLDLKLPRKSGLEVLKWLRQQPEYRALPVVALTHVEDAPEVRRAYQLGINSYLVKPVTDEGMINMVKILKLYWLKLNELP